MSLADKKQSLIDEAQKVRQQTVSILEKANEQQLQTKVSSHAEAWTILEVAKHLYVSEDGMVQLMQRIKDHSDPNTLPGVPEDFDRDRYNKRQVQKLEQLTKADILTKMSDSRKNFVSFVQSLSEEDLSKKGRHASLNVLSIEEICKIIPTHELEHIQKMENALK